MVTDNGIPPENATIGSVHLFAWGDVERPFMCTRGGWDDGKRLWDAVDMTEHGWTYLRPA